jgi:hypothetical protein
MWVWTKCDYIVIFSTLYGKEALQLGLQTTTISESHRFMASRKSTKLYIPHSQEDCELVGILEQLAPKESTRSRKIALVWCWSGHPNLYKVTWLILYSRFFMGLWGTRSSYFCSFSFLISLQAQRLLVPKASRTTFSDGLIQIWFSVRQPFVLALMTIHIE